jgi:hypothetical protein
MLLLCMAWLEMRQLVAIVQVCAGFWIRFDFWYLSWCITEGPDGVLLTGQDVTHC